LLQAIQGFIVFQLGGLKVENIVYRHSVSLHIKSIHSYLSAYKLYLF